MTRLTLAKALQGLAIVDAYGRWMRHADSDEAGHLFRFHSGRRSDLKPATFLDLSWVDFDDVLGLEFRSRV
ncbi:hypothetical protein [Aurantimonas sp. C2-6-R+9]